MSVASGLEVPSSSLISTFGSISSREFSQLSNDLDYIQENDEHADIAAGDRVIDDSLVDDVLENLEEKPGQVEAETRASEAVKDSVLHKHLKFVKDTIVGEESSSGKIGCYSRGDFFMRSSHPVFALRDAKDTGLKPDSLYEHDVFVWVPDQLPGHPDSFKSYISARGAISKVMMWQICNTSATRFGPGPFSGLVSEIQHRQHADIELMYLGAADHYGQSGCPPCSAFDDPAGYAGSPPSVPYIRGMFTDYVTAHRIYIERDIATKPLTVASQDHTFAFLKGMGGVKGEPIFAANFTVKNEFEEVRGIALTPSKSLGLVKDMFLGFQQGLKDSNNPPTQIVYTDSPQAERSFHESINSALTKNVERITNWTDCPPFRIATDVPMAVVTDPVNIEDAANEILAEFQIVSPQYYPLVLAIKSEQPSGAPSKLHFIQLRTRNKIFAFKVTDLTHRSHCLPSLRAILSNPAIIKIGHSVRQSLQTISDVFSLPEVGNVLRARNPPILELGKYAKLKGVIDDPSVSLHALAGTVLQRFFSVDSISLSSASGHPSELNELLLREVDCQWQIYASLHSLDSLGLPLQLAQTTTDGQLVTLLQACKPIAEGSIIGAHPGYLDAIMDDVGQTKRFSVSRTRSLIHISKWIFTHGAKAVVTTSQLHSRGETAPVSTTTVARGFALPAPPASSDHDEDLVISYATSPNSGRDTLGYSSDSESDSDSEIAEEDEYSWEDQEPDFQVQPVNIFSFTVLITPIYNRFSATSNPDKCGKGRD
ncbi:hypothetical protein C8R47DRAFT_1265583 [Mycena vitilis]|nr:hypothetical protein C8R47DRAFT_1265583 [Mycena vitilis]